MIGIFGDAGFILHSVPSILRSNRFRRDARALDEDEELWFNEDEDEEGEAVVPPVEKSKADDDFPDSYEKFMETKKGGVFCYSCFIQKVVPLGCSQARLDPLTDLVAS